MTLALIVEIALTVLLAATLVYCAILERRLAALRKGQDGFKETISGLNASIASAGSAMRTLKAAAGGAAEALDERLTRARNLVDELSLLMTSGDRIAERIERSATVQSERTKPAAGRATPAVLANRLDALKPQIPRTEAARVAGNVR